MKRLIEKFQPSLFLNGAKQFSTFKGGSGQKGAKWTSPWSGASSRSTVVFSSDSSGKISISFTPESLPLSSEDYQIIDYIAYKNPGFKIPALKHDLMITYSELVHFVDSINRASDKYLSKNDLVETERPIIREYLLSAKKLAEDYISHVKHLKDREDKSSGLQKKQMWAELQAHKDLQKLYPKTLYLLGKTYPKDTMTPEEISAASKYFKASKYFGLTASSVGDDLYEKLLAELNLNNFKLNDLKDAIFALQQWPAPAKELWCQNQLATLIKSYGQLKNDGRSYVSYYQIGGSTEFITPNKDIYHIAKCVEPLIECLVLLLKISEDRCFRENCLDNLAKEIEDFESRIYNFTESKGFLITDDKHASLYRTFENILIKLETGHLTLAEVGGSYAGAWVWLERMKSSEAPDHLLQHKPDSTTILGESGENDSNIEGDDSDYYWGGDGRG